MYSCPHRLQPIRIGCRPALFLILSLFLVLVAEAQQGTLTLTVHAEGKPVTGARIAFHGKGDKFDFPPTDPSGRSHMSVNVSDVKDEYVEVWAEQCGRQSSQVFLVGPGSKPPAETTDCLRHKAGFFILRGEGPWQVTTDVALLTVTTAGPVPVLPPSSPADEEVTEPATVWFQGGFGAGMNLFPRASDNCQAIIQVEPSATCAVNDHTFAFLANGSVHISIFAIEGGFWHAAENKLTAATPAPGGSTTLISTYQPMGGYAAGGVRLPVGRFSMTPKGGVTFWRVELKQSQSPGGTSSSDTVTGTSPFLGGSVETMITNHFGVGADYVYLRLRHLPTITQDNHLVLGHVIVRFGRKQRP